ncbi:hypothetical protein WJX77_003668 [Trebouxia sp. C0004]
MFLFSPSLKLDHALSQSNPPLLLFPLSAALGACRRDLGKDLMGLKACCSIDDPRSEPIAYALGTNGLPSPTKRFIF